MGHNLSESPARGRLPRVIGVAHVCLPESCMTTFHELIAAVAGLARLDVLLAGAAYGWGLSPRLVVYDEHRQGARQGAGTRPDQALATSTPSDHCTTGCTSRAGKAKSGLSVEDRAAALAGLSPEDRARLLALLAGPGPHEE